MGGATPGTTRGTKTYKTREKPKSFGGWFWWCLTGCEKERCENGKEVAASRKYKESQVKADRNFGSKKSRSVG